MDIMIENDLAGIAGGIGDNLEILGINHDRKGR